MATDKHLQCKDCGTNVPYASRECVGCGTDVGFPNVRAANRISETDALEERVRSARISAGARNCVGELEDFGRAVSASKAVLARSLPMLDSVVSNQQAAMVSYYKLTRSGARLPEDNQFDENRARIDGTINPYGVHENIQYAALSLNGLGVSWYGDYSITLADKMISSRSTVFEENPFSFCDKHPIPPTGSVPPGYRAAWDKRGDLGMAKLHPRIEPDMKPDEFADILMEQGVKNSDTDFIEVHIYGALHVRAFEKVILSGPVAKPDRLIWARVKRALKKLGTEVVEV